jgi:hypothetical protein
MVATAASHREEVRVRSRLDERVSRAPGLAPHDSNLRAETRLELPADAERTLRRRRPIDANDDRSGSPLSGGGSPRDQDRATGTVQDSRRYAAEHGPGRTSQAVRPHCHQLRALGGRRVQKTRGRLASGLVGLHVDGACASARARSRASAAASSSSSISCSARRAACTAVGATWKWIACTGSTTATSSSRPPVSSRRSDWRTASRLCGDPSTPQTMRSNTPPATRLV